MTIKESIKSKAQRFGQIPFVQSLFVRKSLSTLQAQAEKSQLRRTLGALDLTLLGVGCVIGTGIFVLTGEAAYKFAGPSIVLSFVLAGIVAGTAALSYSELTSMIPISGSAYTYTYSTMGELLGWIIGWDLILEYMIGAAAVAVGWSAYLVSFFEQAFKVTLKAETVNAPVKFVSETQSFETTGAVMNIPAILIILFVTLILVIGIRESARANAIIVAIKVIVVLMFIFGTCSKVDTNNWKPFIPPNEGSFSKYGATGMLTGATTVFFAYIGFDSISTAAQEAKNPQRDLPIGIISSLTICTALYVAVSLVLTGIMPYTQLDGPHPLTKAVDFLGMRWLSIIISLGAIAGLTSVLLILLMGQPRIFWAMAEDGLFPKIATRVHPRFKTPWVTTVASGVICAILSGLLPIDVLAEMTSVGTLLAFFLVQVGVIILRFTQPDAPRGFRVPGGPFIIPVIGAALCILLLATATVQAIERLFIWMAIGLVIYFAYSRRHSKLNNPEKYSDDNSIVDGGELGEKPISSSPIHPSDSEKKHSTPSSSSDPAVVEVIDEAPFPPSSSRTTNWV